MKKFADERLRTKVAGVEFKNPFILGVGPPTMDADRIIRAANMGWAGASHKTVIIPPSVDTSPRIAMRRVDGVPFINENIELLSTKPIEQWEKWVPQIKAKAPSDFVLISSIMGGGDPETWKEPLVRMQEAGTDMIELNVSCPNDSPKVALGAVIGQDASLVGRITKLVKRYAKVPVLVKFTPNVTDIKPIAKAADKAGADGYTVANTHGPGIIGIDIYKDEPIPSVAGYTSPGGISGPAIKPQVLRLILDVGATVHNPEIFGLGGVVSWHDAVEHMMVGAKAVEAVTAILWYGYGVIDDYIGGLEAYMDERRMSGISDIVGRVRPKVVDHRELSLEYKAITYVNQEKCIACSRCLDPCSDGGAGALYYDADSLVVRSNPDKCGGCGVCVNICPTGAIQLMPQKEAREAYRKSLTAPVPSLSSRIYKYFKAQNEGKINEGSFSALYK